MPTMILYGVMALAIIGSLAGLYGTIHHSGVNEGRAEVQKSWDAASARTLKRIADNKVRQETLRQEQDKQATRRLADEKKRTGALMVSLESHIKASGAAVQCRIPDSLRDDWNRANGGPEGAGTGAVPPAGRKPPPPR